MDAFGSYDALGLAALVKAGEVTPLELVDTAIERIEAINPQLNAVVQTYYDEARRQAEGVPDGPFKGVPYLMKEVATTWAGVPQTNCSPFFKDNVASADSDIVARIRRAGFILVGSTNAPELGWALTSECDLFGRANNPWCEGISPGGSSGGAASAVASRMVPLAEASDGAGSIRCPASQCGLFGLKPARGRMTVGPVNADFTYGGVFFLCVTRTVRDSAAFLDATAGALPGEPYNTPPPARPWLEEVGADPGRLRVGFTVTAPHGVHEEAVTAVKNTARLLEALGHDVEEHDMAIDIDAAWRAYSQVIVVQMAGWLGDRAEELGRDPTLDDVSATTLATLQRGRAMSAVEHARDVETIRRFSRAIAMDLADYDVFLTPTLTHPPRPFGHWDMSEPDLDRYHAKWTDGSYLFPFNVSGQPAMSMPLHWSADGLPIGVQFVGRPCDEATLIRVAAQVEAAQPWIDRRPPICAWP